MSMRLYGPKVGWKDDKELTKTVEEGEKKIERIVLTAKVMKGRRLSLQNRTLIVGNVRSMQRLARAAKRPSADKKTARELRNGAPSWYVELVTFVERAENNFLQGQAGRFDRLRPTSRLSSDSP